MRIGILDHVSAGGVSRFVANLIDGLLECEGVESISYFVSAYNIERDGLRERWAGQSSLDLVPIVGAMDHEFRLEASGVGKAARRGAATLSRFPWLYRVARSLYRAGRDVTGVGSRPWYEYELDPAVIDALNTMDVVYVAWPFFVALPDLDVPLVATFHDLHFEHFPDAYAPRQLEVARELTAKWLQRVDVCVTSTEFMAGEIVQYYGGTQGDSAVVYLAAYTQADPDAAPDEELVKSVGARHPYVIYSGGMSAHKNVASIFEALSIVGPHDATRPMLVMTGARTDLIGTGSSAPGTAGARIDAFIAEHGLKKGVHYLPLGYVSARVVDELTRAADLVISASLYEAGCGPALDAWQLGAPIAFSAIPPFHEQTVRFGVSALEFDPLCPEQIADAIVTAVTDPAGMRVRAKESQDRMRSYTWDDVALGYLQSFKVAIARRSQSSSGATQGEE